MKRSSTNKDIETSSGINFYTIKDLNESPEIIENPETARYWDSDKVDLSKSIKKGELFVSFKQSIGIVKEYKSDLPAFGNEAIDVITLNDGYNIHYVKKFIGSLYLSNIQQNTGSVTINDDIKDLLYMTIPSYQATKEKSPTTDFSKIEKHLTDKDENSKLDDLMSYQLQMSIAKYIEDYNGSIDGQNEILEKMKVVLETKKEILIKGIVR